MTIRRCIVFGLCISFFVLMGKPGPALPSRDRVKRVMKKKSPSHPRLFQNMFNVERLRRKVAADPLLKKTYDHVLTAADRMLDKPRIERELTGKRMLGVSRRALKRVVFLAFSYRMTGEEPYRDRAVKTMRAAASFSNWNPDHFLDVSEMTAALAVGYDWLYPTLGETTRKTLRDAIIENGLTPSMEGGWWVDTTNNWNQVCHGGLTLGALAVMEDAPKLARRVITRAVRNVPRAMQQYRPDGAYPEGPNYWTYGTTYNVLFLSGLTSVLDTTFKLSQNEGFMRSASYYLHVTGSTGSLFNYSDGGADAGVTPVVYWFSRKRDRPELLWWEVRRLTSFLERQDERRSPGPGLLPFLLIWAPADLAVEKPERKHWKGDGRTPVAFHRSGWTDDATYVGMKGGAPETNHGHMDVGSFVLDAEGVRWATDLGGQDYNSLEQKNVDLWSMDQISERWNVFRLNNFSHNTLVVNGEKQRVYGYGHLYEFVRRPPDPHTIVNISSAYEGQLKQALRGVSLRADGTVLLQDHLEAPSRPVTVRWGMATRGAVRGEGDPGVTLKRKGKRLRLQVLRPECVTLEVHSVADPPNAFDAPNPGVRMIGFRIRLNAGSTGRIAVHFVPGSGSTPRPVSLQPLERW